MPGAGGRIDVLIVLSHGFAARMVLHSELLAELRALGVRVGVVSPNADEDAFFEDCSRAGVPAWRMPLAPSRLRSLYESSRRYLLEDFGANAALRFKHRYESESENRVLRTRARVGVGVNQLTRRIPVLKRAIRKLEPQAFRDRAVRAQLQRLGPRVVLSTYPVNPAEAVYLNEAKALGVRTLAQLLSWDNILTKGVFPVVPDHFLVWGGVMAEEILEHYGHVVPEEDWVGVPHFDRHVADGLSGIRTEVMGRLGLDPDAPTLFFGMSAVLFSPHEAEVVAALADRVRADVFGPRMQLVVRPHPQNVRGSMASPEVLDLVRSLAGRRTGVHMPPVVSDRLAWMVPERDLWELAALLEGASCCMNSGSTLSLDALIHGVPTVLPLFDGGHELPAWRSVARIEDYPHYKKLLSYGALSVARSQQAFEEAIHRALEAGLDPVRRAEVTQAYFGTPPGRASRASAAAIARYALAMRASAA